MRRKLVAVVMAFLAFGFVSAEAQGESDFRKTSGTVTGFGGSPDRSGGSYASIIGVNDRGDAYVDGRSGTWDEARTIYRLTPDGKVDQGFRERTRSLYGRLSSAAVSGDRLLVSSGKRVLGLLPDGRIDRSFANGGSLSFDRRVRQVADAGRFGFYVAVPGSGRRSWETRIVRFGEDGRKIVEAYVDELDWFEIKAVAPNGAIAYLTGGDSGDYGTFESIMTLGRDLKGRAREVASIDYVSFGDTVFRPGGGILVSEFGSVAAYDSRGRKVNSFGEDGYLPCPYLNGFDSPSEIAVDDLGRIVGAAQDGTEGCGIGRFDQDGSLDASFDAAAASKELPAEVTDVAFAGDRVLVASWDHHRGGPDVLAFREDGTVDSAFGDSGVARMLLRTPDIDLPEASTPDSRGRILVAGLNRTADGDETGLALARYRRDGGLDTSYGKKGRVKLDLGGRVQDVDAVLLGSGDLMLAGTMQPKGGDRTAFLVKLDHAGKVDPGFGDGGSLKVTVPGAEEAGFRGVAPARDGFIATGFACCEPGDQDVLVARFDESGAPVESFGGDGFVIRDLWDAQTRRNEYGDLDSGVAVALDRRGGPVVFAETEPAGAHSGMATFALSRKGSRSGLFGGRTHKVPAFRTGKGFFHGWKLPRRPRDVEVLDSGSVLYGSGFEIHGYSGVDDGGKAAGTLTMLKQDGGLDRRFGTRGQVSSDSRSFMDMEIDECGRILVGGSIERKGSFTMGVSRFGTDGGSEGASRITGSRLGGKNSIERASTLSLVGEGVLVGGSVAPTNRSEDFGIVGFRTGGKCR